jgi:hypothetical protein
MTHTHTCHLRRQALNQAAGLRAISHVHHSWIKYSVVSHAVFKSQCISIECLR